jgi:hypothetical protein
LGESSNLHGASSVVIPSPSSPGWMWFSRPIWRLPVRNQQY